MKYKTGFLFFLLGLIFESTILPRFSIFGITANVLLCFVILFSYLYDKPIGLIFGTIFTLMRDVLVEPVVGIGALNIFALALLIQLLRVYFNKENLITVLIFSVGGTIIYNLGYWLLLMLAGFNFGILFILEKLPIMIILNVITVVVLYFILIGRITRYRSDEKYQGGYSPYKIMLKK